MSNPNKELTQSEQFANKLFEQGLLKIQDGNFGEALQLFNQAISLNSSLDYAYYLRGLIYANTGQYQEAIADCTKALELNPNASNLADIYHLRGNCFEDISEKSKALEDYEKAIQINPNHIAAHHRRGSIFSIWGQMSNPDKVDTKELLQLAMEDFNFVLQAQPDNIQVYRQRGMVKFTLEDEVGAIQDFSICIQHDPNDNVAYYYRSFAFSGLGKHQESIHDLQKVIKICLAKGDKEGYEDAYFLLEGKQSQNSAQAVSPKQSKEKLQPQFISVQIDSLFQSDNDEATYYLKLGLNLYKQEKLNEAIHAFKTATNIDSSYAMAYCLLGIALNKLKRLNEAVKSLEMAILINPNDSNFYAHLGYSLADRGDLSRAIEAFKKAINLKTEDAGVYHYLGDLLKQEGNLREAIEAYQQAIKIHSNVVLYNKLALALAKYKYSPSEAIETFMKAITISPEYPESYLKLGSLLHYHGRELEALKMYEKAKQIYKNQGDIDAVRVLDSLSRPSR